MSGLNLSKLFESPSIGQMRLKNRLVCPPMMRNYGSDEGFVTQRSIDHYEAIAKGGVGLIIVEATCIDSPRGRGWDYGLVLDDDRFIPSFRNLAQAIQQHGAKVAVQLHHIGARANLYTTHMQPVGPSALRSAETDLVRELTGNEIRELVIKFARAAERAKRAGLDGVEIHGAHMYLISQFLSPSHNKREDKYGGSLENRARFPLETLQAIKESVGKDFPVWFRINGQEFGMEDGLTIRDSARIAMMLEKAGADAIHVSAGGAGEYLGYGGGVMYDPPGNLIHLAEAVKKVVKIPVIAVGKLNLELAEEILKEGKADLIALGRSLLTDPDLPRKALEGRFEDIRPCLRCRVCGDIYIPVKRSGIRCQVNAALGNEREYKLKPPELKKRVLIVGGGPAGMEAARVAALRGHEVTLYEKEPNLGGQMFLASIPPYKTPILDFVNYLSTQIEKLGVKVELGREATPNLIESLRPDVVILATGVVPLPPRISGVERMNLVTVESVLREKAFIGEKVAVIGGGMVGCEVADYLSEKGKKVTVVEMLPEMALGLGARMRSRLLSRLKTKGVVLLTNTKCLEIRGHELIYIDSDGQTHALDADTIVLATGSKPNRELYEKIANPVDQTYLVGDCVEPGRILEAVSDGFRIARMI